VGGTGKFTGIQGDGEFTRGTLVPRQDRCAGVIRNRLVGDKGAIDDDLYYLALSKDNKPFAFLATYSAHATVLSADNMQFSSDYPGYWQRAVEQATGGHGGRGHSGSPLPLLCLTAMGVVYGDIGTSPLYSVRECFFGSHGVPVTHENVMGVLSLAAAPIAGVLVDRFSERATIALGTVTSALGFVAMLGATNISGFALSSGLLGASCSDEFARVHVHADEGFGLFQHDVPARPEPDLRAKRPLELRRHARNVEQRRGTDVKAQRLGQKHGALAPLFAGQRVENTIHGLGGAGGVAGLVLLRGLRAGEPRAAFIFWAVSTLVSCSP
jgi:hypothetical protein